MKKNLKKYLLIWSLLISSLFSTVPTFAAQKYSLPIQEKTIVSKFGNKKDPVTKQETFNYGIDLKLDKNHDVKTMTDGVVDSIQIDNKYGKTITVKTNKGYVFKYCNLTNIKIQKDDEVKAGQIIGLIKKDNDIALPTFHLEILKDDLAIDPEPYISNLESLNDLFDGKVEFKHIDKSNEDKDKKSKPDEDVVIEVDKKQSTDDKLITSNQKAIINGYTDNTFKPDEYIKKEEFLNILYKEAGFEGIKEGKELTIRDLDKKDWSYIPIVRMIQEKIIDIEEYDYIYPKATITKAESMKILAKFYKVNPKDPKKLLYHDHELKEYISIGIERAWIKGDEEGNINPDNQLTRVEAVTILNSAFNRTLADDISTHKIKEFKDVDKKAWYYKNVMTGTQNLKIYKDEDGKFIKSEIIK